MPRVPTIDVLVSPAARRLAMEDDVRTGLSATPKSIPPVWFYDEVGSRLFDEITRLPEYYLTRSERSILAERSAEIVDRAGAVTLVEIGSGTSEKTRLLLDAMAGSGHLQSIVLLDISEEILREAAEHLVERYDVEVHAVVGDLRSHLTKLPPHGRQLWAFLGSTIGNFNPAERRQLFTEFRNAMRPGDSLLLGTDLEKDAARLVAAYDDAQGVTAAFNLNVLSVLNDALNADFDPHGFEHRALWNAENKWIEMRLRSRHSQIVGVEALDLSVDIAAGEDILTEISAKFDRHALPAELSRSGLRAAGSWSDPAGDFLLTLAQPQ
jgi:L-histidine N-alpha-methyltransferase